MSLKRYNLAQVNADLDNALLRAQEDLENTIGLYGEATDAVAECERLYRQTRGDTTRALRAEGMPATLINEIAKGGTSGLKAEVIKAEGTRKRYQMMVSAIEHRINTLKFIGRRTDAVADQYMGDG